MQMIRSPQQTLAIVSEAMRALDRVEALPILPSRAMLDAAAADLAEAGRLLALLRAPVAAE